MTETQLKYRIAMNETKLTKITCGSFYIIPKEYIGGDQALHIIEIIEDMKKKKALSTDIVEFMINEKIPFSLKPRRMKEVSLKKNISNYFSIKYAQRALDLTDKGYGFIDIGIFAIVYDYASMPDQQRRMVESFLKDLPDDDRTDSIVAIMKLLVDTFHVKTCMDFQYRLVLNPIENLQVWFATKRYNCKAKKNHLLLKI